MSNKISTDLYGNILPASQATQALEVVGPNPNRYLKDALSREIEYSLQQRALERRDMLPLVNEFVVELFNTETSKDNIQAKTKLASQILSSHGFTMPSVNLQIASDEARKAKEEETFKTIEIKEVSGEELIARMLEAAKADEASKAWREAERKRKGLDVIDADEEIHDAPGESHGA